MNVQRDAIYKKRNHALSGERLAVDISTMFAELTQEIVNNNRQRNDYQNFQIDSVMYFGVEPKNITEEIFKNNKINILDSYQNLVFDSYEAKMQHTVEQVLPLITAIYQNEGEKYRNIALPFTDGERAIQVIANLEDAVRTNGASVISTIEKTVVLSLIDEAWTEHLRAMDDLKDSTQAAGFEQKDPLVIYKLEAFNLFRKLVSQNNRAVLSFLNNGIVPIQRADDVQQASEKRTDMSKFAENKNDDEENPAQSEQMQQPRQATAPIRRDEPKIGRNDQCPCGSGKKFKSCHGVGTA